MMPVDVFMITNPRVRPSRVEQASIDVREGTGRGQTAGERTYPQALDLPLHPANRADEP